MILHLNSITYMNYLMKPMMFVIGLTSPVGAQTSKQGDQPLPPILTQTQKILAESQPDLKVSNNELQNSEPDTSSSSSSSSSLFGLGRNTVAGLSPPELTSAPGCQRCQTHSLEDLGVALPRQPQAAVSDAKPTGLKTELLVFVSLSMPEASLKQLAFEAEQWGGRLILQGLLENSFQKTLPKLQRLQLNLEIDPTLFDLFQINRVPTFVRCRTSTDGPLFPGHDRITGNISLQAALEHFKSLGEQPS